MFLSQNKLALLQQNYASLDISIINSVIMLNYILSLVLPIIFLLLTAIFFVKSKILFKNEKYLDNRAITIKIAHKAFVSTLFISAIMLIFTALHYNFYYFNSVISLINVNYDLNIEDVYFVSQTLGINLKNSILISNIGQSLLGLSYGLIFVYCSFDFLSNEKPENENDTIKKTSFKLKNINNFKTGEKVIILLFLISGLIFILLALQDILNSLFFSEEYIIDYINSHYI